jgi:hypothetical protein
MAIMDIRVRSSITSTLQPLPTPWKPDVWRGVRRAGFPFVGGRHNGASMNRQATGGRIALKGFFPRPAAFLAKQKSPCPLCCFPPVAACRRGPVVAASNEGETP